MPQKKPAPSWTPLVCQHLLLAMLAAAATMTVGAFAVSEAQAKSPGTRYCFHGYCHRVGTLAQTRTLVGWRGYLLASYYDSCRRDRLNPCGLTSSGAVFRPDLPDNAASPLLPDGTVILAYNPKSSDASVLRITNAGPYSGSRKLDVSRAAADKLGFRRQGVAPLVIAVLQAPTMVEATYVRRRVYPRVPGYIGKFETFDAALEAAQARLDVPVDVNQADGELTTAELMPRPQLAVSPSLARELVMLRSHPRPVSRLVPLLHGPRLVNRDSFRARQTSDQSIAAMDFASGFRKYLQEKSVLAFGDW